MKKFLLLCVIAVSAVAAKAQIYVGGELGFWSDDDYTTFRVIPEVGYNLSDKWAIGVKVGYSYQDVNDADASTIQVAPYARLTYASFGNVNLFLDGGFDFATTDVDGMDDGWQIGIKPGVSVNLTDKLSFVSHFGFLGYRDDDSSLLGQRSGFGLDLNGNNLMFGLYYNF